MARDTSKKKRPYFLKTLFFGAISLTSYILLFIHQDWITEHYTKGGYYAAYPIITAFYFSFIHGAFGSNLLSLLGLEAKQSKKK
jgi:hypothetical protein